MCRLPMTGARGALSAGVLLIALACASSAPHSQEAATGADEFRFSCASCHGVDGKGGGVVASILTRKPTDLTILARQNRGEFPKARVHEIIDGRTAFYAHGDRTMPVWGIRYLLEHAVRHGGEGSEQLVQARIDRLVRYIESIQE